MKGKAVFLAMLLSVLLAGRAEAQRCLPKMRGIEMKAGMTGADGYWLGAALSSYARGGNKWVYGAEYLQTNHPYRSVNVPVAQFTAEGGFYYNFLSDVKKTVFFYAGGVVPRRGISSVATMRAMSSSVWKRGWMPWVDTTRSGMALVPSKAQSVLVAPLSAISIMW